MATAQVPSPQRIRGTRKVPAPQNASSSAEPALPCNCGPPYRSGPPENACNLCPVANLRLISCLSNPCSASLSILRPYEVKPQGFCALEQEGCTAGGEAPLSGALLISAAALVSRCRLSMMACRVTRGPVGRSSSQAKGASPRLSVPLGLRYHMQGSLSEHFDKYTDYS